jgi:hypothetical protein
VAAVAALCHANCCRGHRLLLALLLLTVLQQQRCRQRCGQTTGTPKVVC